MHSIHFWVLWEKLSAYIHLCVHVNGVMYTSPYNFCILLQVAQMTQRYPTQCEALFLMQESKKLTAIELYDLFQPCYSLDGSNTWEKELETMFFWMTLEEWRYSCFFWLGGWGDSWASVLCGGYILIQLSPTFERYGVIKWTHLHAYRMHTSTSISSHDVSFHASPSVSLPPQSKTPTLRVMG